MSLILFTKSASFMDKYRYEEGVTYEVPDRLRVKFCEQIGIAVDVSEDNTRDVQPNPSAELYDGNELANAPALAVEAESTPEAAPEPAVEAAEEVTDEAPAPRYELKGRGGPWFILVDTSTGEELPGKPMRKRDAERKIDELANQDIQPAAE